MGMYDDLEKDFFEFTAAKEFSITCAGTAVREATFQRLEKLKVQELRYMFWMEGDPVTQGAQRSLFV